MLQNDAFIAELKYEAANTRKMLERIPEDKFAWKPHDKSMTIGRLASHIAEIPVWVNRTLEADTFDFATAPLVRNTYENTAALLKVFEEKQAAAITALQNASDEMLNAMFAVYRGEQVIFEMPRKVMIRNFAYNHLIHHRGQLSVCLRLLNVPVPGMYGPSADER
ncbi:MAG: DinB family protein [Bacteroidota bacterium]